MWCRNVFLNCVAILIFVITIESAKILAIFPFCGPSQYLAVEPLLKKLAERGHELTVISQFPQNKEVPNFKDITLHYEGYDEFVKANLIADGTVVMRNFLGNVRDMTLLVFESPDVQQLLKSKTVHFDLVILETMANDALFGFGPHFNAHLVSFSSFGTDGNMDELVGNTSPVSYIPQTFTVFTDRMNYWERLENLKINILLWYESRYNNFPWQRQVYRKYFPHLQHELEHISRNFSLVLLNQHFSLSFPRPYVPNMIEVGGLFIKNETKPLTKDMADFIDNSPNGVIFFSLGSNVKSEFLPQEKIDILLRIFGSLKERVMWKFEKPELPNKPPNVFISKWFPQADILAHPNVKLFITHAGLLSTIEAIYYAKPMVTMPVFFDQFLNAARAQKEGYSLKVNFKDFTEQELRAAIREVLENKSYSAAIKLRSQLFHDQPIKPMDKAVYWIEYVLRHNGAGHMRVAAQELSLWQYHSVDTLGFIFGIVFLLVVVIVLIVKLIIKLICGRRITKKQKML